MTRHFALLAIALFNYVHPLSACNYQNELSFYPDHNKALYNHSFSNFSKTTLENCLAHCLKDCLCLSFQICNNNDDPQCQLCSSNKYIKPLSLKQSDGCTNYNFGSQDDKELVGSRQKCSQNIPVFNCCLTSNPCLNDGKCVPLLSSKRTRYRCDYPAGYRGDRRCKANCSTSLFIKSKSEKNYAIITGFKPQLVAITVSLWIKTTQNDDNAYFITYKAPSMNNAFSIYNTGQLMLTINNNKRETNSTLDTQVLDGNWHHLCTTWRSQDGAFAIYKDGIIVGNGYVAKGVTIPSGGAWVLGQEQDTVGGDFDESQAFEGELAEVHIFDKVLSMEKILEMKETCAQSMRMGSVISWNNFTSGVHGDVEKVPATCC